MIHMMIADPKNSMKSAESLGFKVPLEAGSGQFECYIW